MDQSMGMFLFIHPLTLFPPHLLPHFLRVLFTLCRQTKYKIFWGERSGDEEAASEKGKEYYDTWGSE